VADDGDRPATIEDLHELALGMPHVRLVPGTRGNPIYQVGGKSFVFFRNPRPDAPFDDVVVIWVTDEAEKQALVQDPSTPFFTTPHFDGHPTVLLRGGRVAELSHRELTEIVQDAWLSQASPRRAEAWLSGRKSR
jgi:hypothetical protein